MKRVVGEITTWTATLADGTEARGCRAKATMLDGWVSDRGEFAYASTQNTAANHGTIAVVDWRPDGTPSRAQLIAALEAAERGLAVVAPNECGVADCDRCLALALVRAALGHPASTRASE